MTLFILVLGRAFQCIFYKENITCSEVDFLAIRIMAELGIVESIFEIIGVVRFFKRKKK